MSKVTTIPKRRQEERVRYFDYGLLMITILLVGIGLLMLYSSSSYAATLEFNDPAHYLKRQLISVGIGFLGLWALSSINYHLILGVAKLFYAFSLLLCFVVIFIGNAQAGSSRWLSLGPVSFQPSELCKVAVIIFIAAMVQRNSNKLGDVKFIIKMFIYILPAFIVVGYNNLSTAIIIFGIAYAMLLIASRKLGIFLIIALLAILIIALYISLYGYRSDRIEIWMDPANHPKGGQVIQGLYAIGSGGFFGKGLGESIQKQGPVPEAQNDMIFSIICEELGVVGAICIVVMYILLIWRLLIIALNSRDVFGSFVVTGIIIHIALQVILNIAVVTNTMPNTGVTLPFISYGGTSLSILIAEIGLALGISRGIYLK